MTLDTTGLIGKVFGRLTVVEFAGLSAVGPKRGMWRCRCSCGSFVTLRRGSLTHGNSRSCGCLKAETLLNRNTSHGEASAAARTPEYKVWMNMRDRCNRPKNKNYKDYGGRGIKVCRRWDSFSKFLLDMGRRPPGFTIERKNNNKGYYPSNCIWANRLTQTHNRRKPNC